MTNNLSRRSFIVRSAVAATSVALARSAVGSGKGVRVSNPKLPAGASGTIWLGGDLQVNRIGLGTAEFTGPDRWDRPADPAPMYAVLRRAVDLGINLIDTADVYGPYAAEQVVREALYPYPRQLVIASKGGQTHDFKGANGYDARPERLRAACEGSLKRLGLERFDLYYLHSPDKKVPYEDSIGELGKLQKEGKIRHIGVSDVNPEQLAKARSIVTVVAVQNPYSILSRQSETSIPGGAPSRQTDDVIAICEREHIAFVPFATLGGNRGRALKSEDARLAGLQALAKERQIDMPQALLAWELARSSVMLPIVGTTSVEHLEDDVAAAKVHLTKKEMAHIG